MDRLIRIRSLDKEIHMIPAENLITKASILSAFLLPADTIVSLAYKINDEKIFCQMDEAGDVFLFPEDWQDDYYVEWRRIPSQPGSSRKRRLDEYHQQRSEPPRIFDERFAMELRNRLYFIPRAQKAFQDPEEPSEETNENEINGECVSPISPRAAVMHAHGRNKKLLVYDKEKNPEENARGIVEIRKCDNPFIRHTMKVIVVDSVHGFVILYSADGHDIFDIYSYLSRPPTEFEWFLGFGLSYRNQGVQQVTHGTGQIRSVLVNHRGHMLTSCSMDGGDSGGPCYSEDQCLIGIMVSSTTNDPFLEDESDEEEQLRNGSRSPDDIWIIPGSLMIEAFTWWQVQQGMIKARPEKERGSPKAKHGAIDTL